MFVLSVYYVPTRPFNTCSSIGTLILKKKAGLGAETPAPSSRTACIVKKKIIYSLYVTICFNRSHIIENNTKNEHALIAFFVEKFNS